MKKLLLILAVALLLINGMGAVYGGWSLIKDPMGKDLHLSPAVLTHTPFRNFLLPGLVLFSVNGLFSFVVLAVTFLSRRHYNFWMATDGCLLTGWIIIQVLWTRTYHPLQVVMGTIGLLLIAIGYLLFLMEKNRNSRPGSLEETP